MNSSFLKPRETKPDPRSDLAKELDIPEGKVLRAEYFSKDVALPPNFLSLASPPADAQPAVALAPIRWAADTALPENEGRFAVVLDHVVSPSECRALLRLAEASVDLSRTNAFWGTTGGGGGGVEGAPGACWRPAMVNAGAGLEVLDSYYRNSERLVWDCQDVADRLWARCLQGEAGEVLRRRLEVLDGARDEGIVGAAKRAKLWNLAPQRWEMRGLNRRMRFLKYRKGQFFRPHCDGNYGEEVDGKVLRTFLTVHLYLNDSVAATGEGAELVGGATSFLSSDETRKVDVDPKAGRVLIFQQRGLYHAGDDVLEGTKYTMRTEIMYELIRPDPEEPKGVKEPAETQESAQG